MIARRHGHGVCRWRLPLRRGGTASAWRTIGVPLPWRFKAVRRPTWRTRQSALQIVDGEGSRDAALARLEAVLFVASGPLSSRRLAELAGLADGTQARTLVRRLNDIYDGRWAEASGRAAHRSAFRAEEVAGGFQWMTRACFSPWLRRLRTFSAGMRLSTPALETLAVVAYRQPVLRAELEAIRGVQCGEVLRQLSERELVRIAGRSPELGRPFLYGTTRKFLQTFGLRSLEELPRASGLLQATDARTSNPITISEDPKDTPEESAVKTAMLDPTADDCVERPVLPFAEMAAPVALPRADEDFEDEEDEDEDEDLEDDDDDDLDDDLEEEEWEEVDDEDEGGDDWEDEDDEEDEDWDEEEDEDWEEEEEA